MYDKLMQTCLATGATCVIDIHNYARWDDTIIGQGGPTNAQFASLWTQLATKYKDVSKVAFGIMNEPHDLNIVMWAETVQAAVTAIRQAGATTQMILLPGTNFTCAVTFISTGSASSLMNVTNLDGTTTNLVFDVHQYLDFDNSGTHDTCAVNNTVGFATLATWLRSNGRQAIIGETGAGGTDSVSLHIHNLTHLVSEFPLIISSVSKISAPRMQSSTPTATYLSLSSDGPRALSQPPTFYL